MYKALFSSNRDDWETPPERAAEDILGIAFVVEEVAPNDRDDYGDGITRG